MFSIAMYVFLVHLLHDISVFSITLVQIPLGFVIAVLALAVGLAS
jgi:hypothetical protein